MAGRGFVVCAFLAFLATARVAAAEAPAGLDTRIDSVRVADDGRGSVVAIELRGRHAARLLRTFEHVAAVALADVDADGDLDVLASTLRDVVLLWRNAGRGRFVLARLPRARDGLDGAPRLSAGAPAVSGDEPGEGSSDPLLPRAATAREPLVLQSFVAPPSFSPLAQSRVAPTGRAPPSRT